MPENLCETGDSLKSVNKANYASIDHTCYIFLGRLFCDHILLQTEKHSWKELQVVFIATRLVYTIAHEWTDSMTLSKG